MNFIFHSWEVILVFPKVWEHKGITNKIKQVVCIDNQHIGTFTRSPAWTLALSVQLFQAMRRPQFVGSLGNMTMNEMKQTFDSVVFEGVIPFPDSAFYAARNRYKADKLVRHLRHLQTSSTELVVGFSPKDISDRVHGYDDFGVMGWTRISLHSSVVSTHRLADKSRLQSDFLKLVLHELGHADGLPHCKNSSSCYMRDANKQNHFPELDGFCDKCKSHLVRRGWKF